MQGEALSQAQKFFAVLHDHEVEEALTRGYSEGGYARAMHLGADVLAARSQRTHVPAVRIARCTPTPEIKSRLCAGSRRPATSGNPPLTHLGVAWDWDLLRSDPRFQDLLRRVGLTP